jgi:hypothetical protein
MTETYLLLSCQCCSHEMNSPAPPPETAYALLLLHLQLPVVPQSQAITLEIASHGG